MLTIVRRAAVAIRAARQISFACIARSTAQERDAAARDWKADPVSFWAKQAQKLTWSKPWVKTLDEDAQPSPLWFAGGELNTCFNAVDRHVLEGNGTRTALVYDSAMMNMVQRMTYDDLLDQVSHCAGALQHLGVEKGDTVVIYMPMVPETVVTMLACARIGAVHSVVFGGFAPHELAVRIDDIKPKLVVYATCGLEPGKIIPYKPLVEKAIALSRNRPSMRMVLQRPKVHRLLYLSGVFAGTGSSNSPSFHPRCMFVRQFYAFPSMCAHLFALSHNAHGAVHSDAGPGRGGLAPERGARACCCPRGRGCYRPAVCAVHFRCV